MSTQSPASPIPFAFSHRLLDDGIAVVSLEGDLDLRAAPRLKWALYDLLEHGHDRIVVDLTPTRFMDSTALGVLVNFRRSFEDGGGFAITGANHAIMTLFEVTKLTQRLELFQSLGDAVAYVGKAPPGRTISREQRPAPSVDQAAPPAEALVDEAREAALTANAALVVGIASTAMPFARSSQDQAERWLRALSQHGDAAIVLAALGASDAALGPVGAPGGERRATHAPIRNAVAAVTAEARRIADRRQASTIHTTDLLSAALEVYGQDFEQALAQSGVTRTDLVDQLRLVK